VQVGVEHLRRDINDPSVSSLAEELRHKLVRLPRKSITVRKHELFRGWFSPCIICYFFVVQAGLKGLVSRLQDISKYLQAVLDDKLPPNREILYNIQTLLATLPNTAVDSVVHSLFEMTNDQHLVIYMASLTRAVLALHDLVNNKVKFKDLEDKADAPKEKAAVDASKDKHADKSEGKESKEKESKEKEGNDSNAAKK
jgi:26S proteasome regulatory subunit N8